MSVWFGWNDREEEGFSKPVSFTYFVLHIYTGPNPTRSSTLIHSMPNYIVLHTHYPVTATAAVCPSMFFYSEEPNHPGIKFKQITF